MALTFVTGPTRAGKSRLARRLAAATRKPVTYVATAARYPEDAEWQERIRRHRAERPADWRTIETAVEERDLAALCAEQGPDHVLLVDSIGTWLAALLVPDAPLGADALLARGAALVDALRAARCDAIVVSEEAGWGIVPEHPSARLFRDVLGLTNQQLAHAADHAYLVVCGYALDLKRGIPIDPLS